MMKYPNQVSDTSEQMKILSKKPFKPTYHCRVGHQHPFGEIIHVEQTDFPPVVLVEEFISYHHHHHHRQHRAGKIRWQ